VKRHYKRLVRRWHPDRFASDPQGIAEATQRMHLINHAYESIMSARGVAAPLAHEADTSGHVPAPPRDVITALTHPRQVATNVRS
jgi:preprotein translocase subunit Sec63